MSRARSLLPPAFLNRAFDELDFALRPYVAFRAGALWVKSGVHYEPPWCTPMRRSKR